MRFNTAYAVLMSMLKCQDRFEKLLLLKQKHYICLKHLQNKCFASTFVDLGVKFWYFSMFYLFLITFD